MGQDSSSVGGFARRIQSFDREEAIVESLRVRAMQHRAIAFAGSADANVDTVGRLDYARVKACRKAEVRVERRLMSAEIADIIPSSIRQMHLCTTKTLPNRRS